MDSKFDYLGHHLTKRLDDGAVPIRGTKVYVPDPAYFRRGRVMEGDESLRAHQLTQAYQRQAADSLGKKRKRSK